MATRLYFPSSGTALITPSTWNFGAQINPLTLKGSLFNGDTAQTNKVEATGTTNPTARAMFRWVYGPLAAQTISGTVKGQILGLESATGANASPALAIKIIKPDGTDRGVLLAQTAADAATAGHEFDATTQTNIKFEDVNESTPISLTSQSALDGDYLVVEVGFRSATATTRNITLNYGNATTTDLPEDTTTTATNNPWIELSQTILFQQPQYYRYPSRERSPSPFPNFERLRPVEPVINVTSIGLSGVAATAAIGILAVQMLLAPTGVAASTGIGIGPVTFDVAQTGVQGTTAIGTEIPTFSFTPTGLQATSGIGSLGFSGWSVGPTGVLATGQTGSEGVTNTLGATGLSSTGAVGTETLGFDEPLNGQSGTALLNGVVATGGTTDNIIERPRVVRGPFPFPKALRFPFISANETFVALLGVQATGVANDIQSVLIDIPPLTGQSSNGQTGTLQASTPGSAGLIGVVGAGQPGTPVANFTIPITGVEGAGILGNLILTVRKYNNPIQIPGPFPFLPGTFFQFKEKARVVNPPSGQSFTAGLIGVAAAGQIGTVTVSQHDNALTGVAGPSNTGIVTPVFTLPLSGLSATGTVGSLGLSQSLSGVQGTGQIGSETVSFVVPLTGVQGTSAIGIVAAQSDNDVSITLIGVQGTTSLATIIPAIDTFALSGLQVASSVGNLNKNSVVPLVGIASNSVLGNPTASGSGAATLAGVAATVLLGTPPAIHAGVPSGLAGIGQIGQVGLLPQVFLLTGVQATASIGTFIVDLGSILDFELEYKTVIDLEIEEE